MKQRAYSMGDRVVLQPYGVGVVSGISTRQVSSVPSRYYQVEFPNSSSRAFVPVGAPPGSGMRLALTVAELPEVRSCLRQGKLSLPRQWSARSRRVGEILAAGDPFEIAALVHEYRGWHAERGLADLDFQAYRRALRLLLSEVRELEGTGVLEVRDWLETACREAGF